MVCKIGRAIAVLSMMMIAAPAPAMDRLVFETPGASEDLRQELQEASLLIAARNEQVGNAQELLAAARADYARLVGALYSEGHFGGVVNILVDGVEAAEIPPLTRLTSVGTIRVVVQPGPTFRFGQARIAPLAPETELPEGFAAGAPARTPVIRDAASAAVDGWRDTGRAKAEVEGQQITARHEENLLNVQIAMAPGPVVRFGDLILKGGESVRPERLREIAGLPVGEIFSPAEVEQATENLRRTGVFSSVALTEAERLGPGNTMDITATLAEQRPRRFGFGAEISTIEGLALSGFWLHRNLLGGAERLRFDAEITGIGGTTGGPDFAVAASFTRPATFGPDTDLLILGELERLDEPDFLSRTGSLGVGIVRRKSENLTVDAGVALRFSRIRDASGSRNFTLLQFPLGATYDSRDVQLDAKSGYYLDAELRPFLGFGDAEHGARLTFDARTYRSFGAESRFTLAGRVQGGSILGAALTAVPQDYRFYSGGGGTVRGQNYQSLGVTLPSGIESGGASFLGLQAELRGEVTDKLGLVAFADWGYVGTDSFGGTGDSHAGAGLGVRYLTPIGPIRLDLAVPVGGGDGFDIYVGIGQAF
ncbi:outer membrane protein assembly factor [Rhodobacteraceae bacterium CCMM004]|nr:outer membrane protein assembly factor [Rhodobacteraceae bacterium CCMM004]